MNEMSNSDKRAKPPCPHFGSCGGCQLQDLSYSAQLEQKAIRLREMLGTFTLPELQLHAPPPLGYRNRIRLTLREVEGALLAGYLGDPEDLNERSNPQFVPITQCSIAAPVLWRTAQAFLTLAADPQMKWLRSQTLTPDQLELFTTADESRVLLTLYLRTGQKTPLAKLAAELAAFCDSLCANVPELVGAGIAFLPLAARGRRIEQPRPGPTWGAPGVNYSIVLEPQIQKPEPFTYWVPRGAFFQANRFLLPELLAVVTQAAASRSTHTALAWDLYAGVGLFSQALARMFAKVTAVEIAEPAVTALLQKKVPNLQGVKATALDFLRAAVLQRDRPSCIVLDPPRSGLGTEVCALLSRIAAGALIYVSCSPHALAADLAPLIASGYSIAELHLFDLFPQTEHIETVVMLTRA